MERSQDSLATLILTNRLTKPEAKPFSAGEFWTLVAAASPSAMIESRPVSDPEMAERIDLLNKDATALALELEQLEHSGIKAVTSFDDHYPAALKDRLGRSAPPAFFAAGDLGLLGKPGLGIVGSRDPHPDVVEVVQQAAHEAVRQEMVVVSGGARGVDQAAMRSAFSTGGQVVGVLADSLQVQVRNADTRRAILDGAALLISLQRPSLGFTVPGAMSRNKVIYALSQVTLVAASDLEKGGTWAGATEAIKNGHGSVAVWMGAGAGPGNAKLAELGARPVSDIQSIFDVETMTSPSMEAAPANNQLGLEI